MEKVLTIAGSDCSGGAGIQADIKTITVHKLYAMSVITALTAQNTTGVYGVQDVTPDFVAQQLDCIFRDIKPNAIKIGMVSNPDIIAVISEKLQEYQGVNIVLDPVMVATSGGKLLKDHAVEVLAEKLIPLAEVITPNIPEAEALCGFQIDSLDDMRKAAEKLSSIAGKGILIKGGHLFSSSDDLLLYESKEYWFREEKINNPNTHGTGCTLSSAIACNLAKGHSVPDSVLLAKKYITGALRDHFDVGKGRGPLNHCYAIR